ncbi:hypothetical protein BGZ59_005154 [Podila verticillata]|nr:hypothetical protein BGZ59_005154 [Podila verticillata]KFH65830.1 hypothetical protein MVEG_07933 [Podila verticillata NRRL 6337]
MVKLSLSFLSVVVFAIVSATPFTVQQPFTKFDLTTAQHQVCLPETSIKEYETFRIQSYALGSFLSMELEYNVVVGGINGNKYFHPLDICIVSTGTECNPTFPTNCIYENKEYRFRVDGPVMGYLRLHDGLVRIVPEFENATGLKIDTEAGWGLRIVGQSRGGSRSALATRTRGEPLTLMSAQSPSGSQWFRFVKSYD